MKNFIANIKWFFRILKENFIYKEQSTKCDLITKADQLKIMTFNIRRDNVSDGINNWQYRKEAIIEMIRDTNPDIICMQEVMPHMAKYLVSELSNNYGHTGLEVFTNKELSKSYCIVGEGLIIFFKKGRFVKDDVVNKIKLYDGRKINLRRALSINLYDSCTKKWINVINTHFCHKSAKARYDSFLKLLSEYSADVNSVFICGDFNCEVNQADSGINVFTHHFTFNLPDKEGSINFFRGNSGKTIDFIFSNECPKDTIVIRKEYNNCKFLSDHWPVINTYQHEEF